MERLDRKTESMKKTLKQKTINALLAQTIAMICIGSAIIISLAFWHYSRSMIIGNADERLLSAVKFLDQLIGDDYHHKIVDGQSISSGEFLSIVDRNDELCRKLGLQYLWSVMVHGDEIVFTSATRTNLDDPTSGHAAFFEVHRDPDAFLPAMGPAGEPVFSSFKNEWGKGRMVLLPLNDAHGRRYIMGASIHLKRLNLLAINTGLVAVLSSTLVFSLIWLISVRHVKRATGVFTDIAHTARQMKAGNLDIPLPETDIVELREFCDTLESFRKKQKKQIEGLTHNNTREKNKNAVLSKVAQGEDLQSLLDALVLFTEENDPSIGLQYYYTTKKGNVWSMPQAQASLKSITIW